MAGLSYKQKTAFTYLRQNLFFMMDQLQTWVPWGYHDGEREYITHGSVTWSGWDISGKEALKSKNVDNVTQE